MTEETQITQTKELYTENILAIPNVVGVGVGYKVARGQRTTQLCIVTMVRRKIPKAGLDPEQLVPPKIGEIPLDVVEVGELRVLQMRTDRWRPAPAGVSIGHYKVTAGTLGAVVRDRSTGARLILSNNHVLANCNDAKQGDPILQPGAADGGQMRDDTIARLERFIPINFDTSPPVCRLAIGLVDVANRLAQSVGSKHRLRAFQSDPAATNLVDAAVAQPLDDADILDEILAIGAVSGTAPAALGKPVRKSGRTTGLTTGDIIIRDATVMINYSGERVARFERQIVTGPMSQGGDSGSLLVAADSQEAVGLLFAGSELTTIHSPIQPVLDSLEVNL